MQAWATSGSPQAPEKINAILEEMRKNGIAPDVAAYNILLRYWCSKGAVDKFEAILETMDGEGVDLSRTILSEAIYGYAKVGNLEKAEQFLHKMLKTHPKDKREACMVAESTQNILLACRKIVTNPQSRAVLKERAVNCAVALVAQMSNSNVGMNDEDQSKYIE
jgi:pentatricopeptide repeat protein